MSFAFDILNLPHAFDGILDVVDAGRRYTPRAVAENFHALNAINHLRHDPLLDPSREQDALTGSGRAAQIQDAHLPLPPTTGMNPALWTWARCLILAPWGGSQRLKEKKESVTNLIPLTYAHHMAIDLGHGSLTLMLAKGDLKELIGIFEHWVQEEEESPTLLIREGRMNHWLWDVSQLSQRLSGRAKSLGEPLFWYQPLHLPTKHKFVIDEVVMKFQSPAGETGTEFLVAEVSDSPHQMPVPFETKMTEGHIPGPRDGKHLRCVRLPQEPLTMSALNIMEQVSRLRPGVAEWSPDLWACPDLQEVLQLQDYLLRLVCSECPSAYRDFERPDDLLGGLFQIPETNAVRIPRHWSCGRARWKPADGNRCFADDDNDDFSSEALSRWREFVRAWRQVKSVPIDFELDTLFSEPLADDDAELNIEAEWQHIRSAAISAGLVNPRNEFNLSHFANVLDLHEAALQEQFLRFGAWSFLKAGDRCLRGTLSMRNVMRLVIIPALREGRRQR